MEKIIGQEQAIKFLFNSYRQQKVSHAYIFLGPKGVGKSLVARFFAQFINCEDRDNAPCLKCPPCQKIEHNNHPDVSWIRPEEDSQGIKIEAIRELQERISLKPYEAKTKVFIIEEADYLLEDAANCLLKTLEEPPGDSLLMLIAQDKGKILPTILSRCQLIKFSRLRLKEIEEFLIAKKGLESEKARFFSRIVEGSLGRAVSFLESDYLDKRSSVWDEFLQRRELDDKAWTDRRVLSERIEMLTGIFRDAIFLNLGLEELVVNIDYKELISKFALRYSSEELYRLTDKLNSYHNWLQHNANARLVLTNLEIDLSRGTTQNRTQNYAQPV